MNAELVVKAIVEIGKADAAALPGALQQLADSLNYKHAAIVEAQRAPGSASGREWLPVRTVCQSREFRRACRSVLSVMCESPEPVRVFTTSEESDDLAQSVVETGTFAAAGVHLADLCSAQKKTVLMMVSDDNKASLSEMEKHLLSTVGTLVCKGLAGKELENPLESAEPRMDETIGIVSHDLRNPVGTILGYTELLLGGKKADEMAADQKMAIGKIRDNSLFILHLLGDLLESSQLDAGASQVELLPWDIGSALWQCVDRCRMLAEKKDIRVEITLERPGIRVFMDHIKIAQVLDNLLSNAIKFSKRGTAVNMSARVVGNMVEVRVEDQGQGIPEDEVQNLFKKFSRTTTRATAGEKSTGLGLYIVSELVKLHGGTVGVNTELDRGSTFTFTLPLQQ